MAKTAEAPAKEKKAKEPEIKYLTTRDVADRIGCKPATLRRYLRTLPAHQDDGYTRYKWNPADSKDMKKVDDIVNGFSKFAEKEKAKNKERIEKIKAEGKTGKKGKKAKDEDEETEEEDEEELD